MLFEWPFVLLNADNTSPKRVDTLDEARAAVRGGEAATAGGRLRPGVLGADVDPADTAADPVLGDAVAEELAAWCREREVPYLVRESGRPGGRHVLAVAGSRKVADQWRRACTAAGQRYGVAVTDRTAMVFRLLSAPHRHGWPAPVVGGTLTTADVLDVVEDQSHGGRPRPPRRRRAADKRRRGGRDGTRSGREFGQACALVRGGYSPAQAWTVQAQPGSKARERGELGWRRWVWLPAVTTVAAEENASENEAWRRAQLACRARCRRLGRSGWRSRLWRPAQRDAQKVDRPRRYRIDDSSPAAAGQDAERTAEVEATRRGLLAVTEDRLAAHRVDVRRRRSAATIVYELVPVLLSDREGSISIRALAERTRLDTKTVRATLATLTDAGIVTVPHRYAGGADDCHQYAVGSAAQAVVEAVKQHECSSSPTSRSAPSPSPTPAPGRASLARLRTTHAHERATWRLRCTLSAVTEASGETYASCTHPAARTLRSLHYQRTWWKTRTEDEKQARCADRKRLLSTLSPEDRSAWLDWLARREQIRMSADHIAGGTAVSIDYDVVGTAPLTVHHGMRDPEWRTGGTKRLKSDDHEQLGLLAA